jgi:Domain of unknown function (DUF1918)
MKATVGDRIVVRGHEVGGQDRHGTIVEVQVRTGHLRSAAHRRTGMSFAG